MKQTVIALKLHYGQIGIGGIDLSPFTQVKLPKGCKGIFFCFESKKAAREFWGDDVPLLPVKLASEEK